jgi:hypothetical protein
MKLADWWPLRRAFAWRIRFPRFGRWPAGRGTAPVSGVRCDVGRMWGNTGKAAEQHGSAKSFPACIFQEHSGNSMVILF